MAQVTAHGLSPIAQSHVETLTVASTRLSTPASTVGQTIGTPLRASPIAISPVSPKSTSPQRSPLATVCTPNGSPDLATPPVTGSITRRPARFLPHKTPDVFDQIIMADAKAYVRIVLRSAYHHTGTAWPHIAAPSTTPAQQMEQEAAELRRLQARAEFKHTLDAQVKEHQAVAKARQEAAERELRGEQAGAAQLSDARKAAQQARADEFRARRKEMQHVLSQAEKRKQAARQWREREKHRLHEEAAAVAAEAEAERMRKLQRAREYAAEVQAINEAAVAMRQQHERELAKQDARRQHKADADAAAMERQRLAEAAAKHAKLEAKLAAMSGVFQAADEAEARAIAKAEAEQALIAARVAAAEQQRAAARARADTERAAAIAEQLAIQAQARQEEAERERVAGEQARKLAAEDLADRRAALHRLRASQREVRAALRAQILEKEEISRLNEVVSEQEVMGLHAYHNTQNEAVRAAAQLAKIRHELGVDKLHDAPSSPGEGMLRKLEAQQSRFSLHR